MIEFDEYGYPKPYDVIELNLLVFEELFVNRFPESTTRKRLFRNYTDFIARFKREVTPYFEQWIDGSFVTLKTDPKDIDFLTFLDYQIYDARRELLPDFTGLHLREPLGLDSYFIKVYPEDHAHYNITQYDLVEWRHRFGIGRRKHRKGIIKITYA